MAWCLLCLAGCWVAIISPTELARPIVYLALNLTSRTGPRPQRRAPGSVRAARTQCGSTLIEALVSILILSFGVLATGALQAYAVAGSKLSSHRATRPQRR